MDPIISKTLRQLATSTDQAHYIALLLTALQELLGAKSGTFRRPVGPICSERSTFREAGALPVRQGSPAALYFPLFLDDELVGTFVLTELPTRPDSPKALESAQTLAQLALPFLRLTRRANQIQELAILEERMRLAGEIHDTLAQHFAGILLQLGVAQRLVAQQPDAAWQLVTQASDLARAAAYEARRSVWTLQPISIPYSDLVKALSQCVTQLTQDTHAQSAFHYYGVPRRLPPVIGVNLYGGPVCQDSRGPLFKKFVPSFRGLDGLRFGSPASLLFRA